MGFCPIIRMAKQLLSNLGKQGDSSYTTNGIRQGLDTLAVDIEDTAHLSKYFRVVEFNPVFTAGKNSISFNGSELLADGSEIKVEVIDSKGTSLYLTAPPKSANYVDIANFTVAIHVYKEIADGAGTVILVGTTARGQTVRWVGNITINTTYKNVSRVRFFNSPTIEVNPRLLPTIDVTTGASLGVPMTIHGSCTGHTRTPIPFSTYTLTNMHQQVPSTLAAANTAKSDYRVDWKTFNSTDTGISGFNSQMVGETITLFITQAENPRWKRQMDKVNSTQSFKIKKVINPNELQLDGDVINTSDNAYANVISPSFVGSFSIGFTQTSYLQQATSVPCNGLYSSASNTTTLITNNSFFTSSMVGTQIQVNYGTLYLGTSGDSSTIKPSVSSSLNKVPVTSSLYTVLGVTNAYTASIGPINYTLYYSGGKTVTYTAQKMAGSVTPLSASKPYQYYTTTVSQSALLQKSYANISYRDIETFSGMVAKQKIYAKSNIFPGDFQLISDTPVGPTELLFDPITVNKNYAAIGVFYNQDQVNQYWYASSSSLSLIQSDSPALSAMTIAALPDVSAADGNSYVIAKVSAINVNNDENYYPYDEVSYNGFSGTGYTSNFIFLAKDVLYALSSNITIAKKENIPAKVSFYITSSSPEIVQEPNYNPIYGLKIGEINVKDKVETRIFSDVLRMYFTPMNDYHGTLVIVPHQCNVTLMNLSLVNYGDHGFSPGGAVVQVPFPVNIANESFSIKADLFDNNSNLVYSIPAIGQTFDPTGASLYGSNIIATSGTGSSTSYPTDALTLTVHNNLYLPGISSISPPMRVLAYNQPQGQVGYTSISNISLIPTNTNDASSVDYINIELNGNTVGRSLALKYSGSSPNVFGRRVYIDPTGVKTTYL